MNISIEQSWQIDAIRKGIEEADKENFATDKEMKEFFARWQVKRYSCLTRNTSC